MTSRSLFEVVIRLFGALCFFTTAGQMVQAAVVWFAPYLGFYETFDGMDLYITQQILNTLFTGILGFVLFCYAPQLALMFYPHREETEGNEPTTHPESRFGPEELYRIALVVFGLSLLTRSVEPFSSLLIEFFHFGRNSFLTSLDPQITQVLVNVIAGIGAIWGSRWLAELLVADKDNASKQPLSKFNFATAVVLLFLFAVLLAVVRMLMITSK